MELPSAESFLAERDADPKYWRRKAEFFRECLPRVTDPERRERLTAKIAEADRLWACLVDAREEQ